MTEKLVRSDPKHTLSNLSPEDFLKVGMDQIAYVRPVKIDDHNLYSVHAADGTALSVADSLDLALAKIHQKEMFAVTLH